MEKLASMKAVPVPKIVGTTARAQYLLDRQAVGRAAEAASVEEVEFSRNTQMCCPCTELATTILNL